VSADERLSGSAADEHFARAVRLVDNAEYHNTEHPGDMRIAEISAYCAQVRATLALAAEVRSLGVWLKEVGDQLDVTPRDVAVLLRLLFAGWKPGTVSTGTMPNGRPE
jgi:hypothetical protein